MNVWFKAQLLAEKPRHPFIPRPGVGDDVVGNVAKHFDGPGIGRIRDGDGPGRLNVSKHPETCQNQSQRKEQRRHRQLHYCAIIQKQK